MANQKTYKWYFILAIICVLFDLTMTISRLSLKLADLMSVVGLAWLLLSIVLWARFIKEKMPKIYLVLPIYYVVSFSVFVIVGIVARSLGVGLNTLLESSWTMYGEIFCDLFEIGFALFILSKKDLIKPSVFAPLSTKEKE